jgi:hypothetical protein
MSSPRHHTIHMTEMMSALRSPGEPLGIPMPRMPTARRLPKQVPKFGIERPGYVTADGLDSSVQRNAVRGDPHVPG